ncbi:flagellar motor switch protein FliN/FliY [Bacillus thermophilus]|uniref:Flagellar motor switch protein FliN/FliY n=1 Tax=Siminovitchia thermophila TaxID=1245522 RepID=A0ABS2RBE1_9BACI|nr:flagellar motor switch phosphatase FliY [Siminovitchia thermophila]MBM7716469.1 flagellar motor switch protein FliN/FliY [Siminovitchia thermophila]
MNNEKLSPEEIEMLLSTGFIEKENENNNEIDDLNEMERDALGEVGNISVGRAATTLSTLLNQKVEITTPTVSMLDRDISDEPLDSGVAVRVTYTSGFSGVNVLILKKSDVAAIADMMLGGDGTSPAEEMDEIHLSAVQEAMNQMIGSAASSMSTFFSKRVDISPPTIHWPEDSFVEVLEELSNQSKFARVSFQLKVGDIIDSTLTQLIPIDFAKDLVKELMLKLEKGGDEQSKMEKAGEKPVKEQRETTSPQMTDKEASRPRKENTRTATQQMAAENTPPNVHKADFSDFNEESVDSFEANNLDVLLDIPLQVTVELGRTSRSVKEILEFGAGSIIELDKLAGEPVDILINNRHIAKGEVVVIDENFGVRVTNILNKRNRLERLR